MSTDVESVPTVGAESSASAPEAANSPAVRSPLWRRRRYQLGGVAVLIVLVASFIANNVLARQYSPDGAVRDYLSALQSGNATQAWNQIQVSSPSSNPIATLVDQAALKGALATAKPAFLGFDITGTSAVDANSVLVAVTFATSSGAKQAKLLVQRSGQMRLGFYPIWRVVVAPTLLTFTLPTGMAGIAIDGTSLALPDGKSVVAVLPLPHRVVFNSTPWLAEQSSAVDTFLSGDLPVNYRPRFTDAGIAKVKAAVSGFFNDVCAKQTTANPDRARCPQATGSYLTYSGQWHVVGDPTQDLTISADASQNIAAVGHFQMVFAYAESGIQGTRHVPSAGAYSAPITLAGSDLTVGNVAKTDGLPALSRPAGASDQAAEDIVTKAMVQCAAVSAETVADCPQAAPDIIISNVHWGLSGDPVSGATVTYDGKSGLVTVQGNFTMSVSYTWFGSSRNRSSYITAYDAYLFWDGQALELVTIDGSN